MQNEIQKDEKNVVEAGFTLVELLIVIVIMGILAGIVVFAVGNLTGNAQTNACKTEKSTLETAVEAYKANYSGAVPTESGTNDSLLDPPGTDAGLIKSASTNYDIDGSGNVVVQSGGKC